MHLGGEQRARRRGRVVAALDARPERAAREHVLGRKLDKAAVGVGRAAGGKGTLVLVVLGISNELAQLQLAFRQDGAAELGKFRLGQSDCAGRGDFLSDHR